jgi:hypothetical protein
MNGESADVYKESLGVSSVENIRPLANYIEKQEDFIIENQNMF